MSRLIIEVEDTAEMREVLYRTAAHLDRALEGLDYSRREAHRELADRMRIALEPEQRTR
jgi:hypothetical protein